MNSVFGRLIAGKRCQQGFPNLPDSRTQICKLGKKCLERSLEILKPETEKSRLKFVLNPRQSESIQGTDIFPARQHGYVQASTCQCRIGRSQARRYDPWAKRRIYAVCTCYVNPRCVSHAQ